MRPIPSVALIPLAVLLFGVRIEATLMLAIWPVLLNTIEGVRSVDLVQSETARSYRIGPPALDNKRV